MPAPALNFTVHKKGVRLNECRFLGHSEIFIAGISHYRSYYYYRIAHGDRNITDGVNLVDHFIVYSLHLISRAPRIEPRNDLTKEKEHLRDQIPNGYSMGYIASNLST